MSSGARDDKPESSLRRRSLGEAIEQGDGDEGQGDERERQPDGLALLACLDREKNGERRRLRAAGDIAREHQRRAKLAKRAEKTEDHAGGDARPGEREQDAPEVSPLRAAEDPSRVEQAGIDLLKRAARRLIHDREGDDERRHDRRRPGKDQGPASPRE